MLGAFYSANKVRCDNRESVKQVKEDNIVFDLLGRLCCIPQNPKPSKKETASTSIREESEGDKKQPPVINVQKNQ